MNSELSVLNNLLMPWCQVMPDPDAKPMPQDYRDGPLPPQMICIMKPDLNSPSRARSIISALDRINPSYADRLRKEQQDAGIPYEKYILDQTLRMRDDILDGRLTYAPYRWDWR